MFLKLTDKPVTLKKVAGLAVLTILLMILITSCSNNDLADIDKLIEEAVEAIDALPEEVTVEDEDIVEEARRKVDKALEAGAKEEELKNLSKLIAAEEALQTAKKLKRR